MGSAQSIVTENAATVAAAVGAVALVGAASFANPSSTNETSSSSSPAETKREGEGEGEKGSKKKKKKQSTPGTTAVVVGLPSAVAIPGQFEDASATDVASGAEDKKKAKKKRSKASLPPSDEPAPTPAANVVEPPSVIVVPEPSTSTATGPSSKKAKKKSKGKKPAASSSVAIPLTIEQSTMFTDRETDAEWTRVESKKSKKVTPTASTSTDDDDAESSAKEEKDEMEQPKEKETKKAVDTPPKPLAERLLPKPRKTGVEDMLETPDHPTLARVMRVIPATEKPDTQGLPVPVDEEFDYGRSGTSGAEPSTTTDDDGWGFVPVKSRKKPKSATPLSGSTGSVSAAQSSSTPVDQQSKKQRQNAAKRANTKAAKDIAEQERLDLLAKHKRSLERERMEDVQPKAGANKVSGGQVASIDVNGKLVWE